MITLSKKIIHSLNFEQTAIQDGKGNITEGPGFNLFRVKDGRLTTPKRGVLAGITRRTALELCAELGLSAQEGMVRAEELIDADEIFLTSTAGGIVPVTRIDGQAVGNGTPGRVTGLLTDLYWQKHSDPAWTTPLRAELQRKA